MLLPLLVGAFQRHTGLAGFPNILVATALGGILAISSKKGHFALLAAIGSGFVLIGKTYIEEVPQLERETSFDLRGQHNVELAPAGHRAESHAPAPKAPPTTAKALVVPAKTAPSPPKVARKKVASAALPPVDDVLSSTRLESVSVVLPCAGEGSFAVKTVEVLLQNTKWSRLLEIIVVDDGSKPPLETLFREEHKKQRDGEPAVRFFRHEKTLGLINSKQTGGDNALGDVIVFFDCHINPNPGWEDAILDQMKRAGDHRTTVVPLITSLNPNTWQVTRDSEGTSCWLTFDAEFPWLGKPGRDVPIMSGGLLAMSRRWFIETEGYDKEMLYWGGENLDQSLRIWLCGGRIEAAPKAVVGHMFRDSKNPNTTRKVNTPNTEVLRNKARAITAWYDEFTEKALSFPEFSEFRTGKRKLGDMSMYSRLKEKLQCRPFSEFIHRFSYVYIDGGYIPSQIFQLREESTGFCLERLPNDKAPHGIALMPCAGGGDGATEEKGGVEELQLWHGAIRNRELEGAPCCGGLMNWDFLSCLDAGAMTANLQAVDCDVTGHAPSQSVRVEGGQLLWQNGKGCVAPAPPKKVRLGWAKFSKASNCYVHVKGVGTETVKAGGVTMPKIFRLQKNMQYHSPEGGFACAVPHAKKGRTEWKINFEACDPTDPQQEFHASKFLGGLKVTAGDTGLCLDAAAGAQLLAYPCYEPSVANKNQAWMVRDELLVWMGGEKGFCVDMTQVPPAKTTTPAPASARIKMKACESKEGQRFERVSAGGPDEFELRDADTGKCLCASEGLQDGWKAERAPTGIEKSLELGPCDKNNLWRVVDGKNQLQHVQTSFCMDAGDEQSPILYPCHQPKVERKQMWQATHNFVRLMRGHEEGGRKRFYEKCLDYMPKSPTELSVQQCVATKRKGVSWTMINPRVPPERLVWDKAVTPSPGTVLLGGEAHPAIP